MAQWLVMLRDWTWHMVSDVRIGHSKMVSDLKGLDMA